MGGVGQEAVVHNHGYVELWMGMAQSYGSVCPSGRSWISSPAPGEKLSTVTHVPNVSTGEAEPGGSQGQPGRTNEFKVSVRSCLRKTRAMWLTGEELPLSIRLLAYNADRGHGTVAMNVHVLLWPGVAGTLSHRKLFHGWLCLSAAVTLTGSCD